MTRPQSQLKAWLGQSAIKICPTLPPTLSISPSPLSLLPLLSLSLSSCVGSRLPDELLYRCIREGERVLVRSKLPPTVSP
jgi:hypothetical protein